MLVGRGTLAMLGIWFVFVLVLGVLLVGCSGSEDEEAASSKVVVRVSGTQGTSYTGAYGLFEEAQRVDDTLGARPTDYEVEAGGGDSGAVSAVFRKTQPGDEGTLKVQILAYGKVADEDETSAELGVVKASWSPQDQTTVEHPGER